MKHSNMIQEKLKNIRIEKGMSQEKMAKILSTGISSYSRKENGKSKIYDDEWEKMAKALEVPVEDLKGEATSGIVHNENPIFNDNSGNYNQYFNLPNSILENLQDYIHLLKEQNEQLKKEIESYKSNS
ncbi:helix-turn-helix domain-containing protein [Chryseobacterium sp. Leaf201]|uniref:helix-turn-helix domain-containing protein n=1 Tax=Chryseobacterium sp. Leaf201 TaxID=1735672 RepID=UPI000B16EAAB|nr:helix-turn-helix transcriptional regulator [Chryseobacterium sp. Leaf201]